MFYEKTDTDADYDGPIEPGMIFDRRMKSGLETDLVKFSGEGRVIYLKEHRIRATSFGWYREASSCTEADFRRRARPSVMEPRLGGVEFPIHAGDRFIIRKMNHVRQHNVRVIEVVDGQVRYASLDWRGQPTGDEDTVPIKTAHTYFFPDPRA